MTDLDEDAESIRLYVNESANGRLGRFTDGGAAFGLSELPDRSGRGSAVADFDNDGDIDVAVNAIGGPAALLENAGPSGNWLTIDTVADVPGATVEVRLSDGMILRRELLAGSSYLSTSSSLLHFGLADDEMVGVVVRWPGGETWESDDVASNQVLVVAPGDS